MSIFHLERAFDEVTGRATSIWCEDDWCDHNVTCAINECTCITCLDVAWSYGLHAGQRVIALGRLGVIK